MVLDVMGRYAGWIAGYAGIAGGADVILIPEIPFDYEPICEKIQQREDSGKKFTLVVVAEGARVLGGDYVTLSNHDTEYGEARLGGIGHIVAQELGKRTVKEARAVVLGSCGGMLCSTKSSAKSSSTTAKFPSLHNSSKYFLTTALFSSDIGTNSKYFLRYIISIKTLFIVIKI